MNYYIYTERLSLVHTVPVVNPSGATVWTPGPHRSDAGKDRIESGYTVFNLRSPGSGPGSFKFLNNRGSLGRTRVQNNAGLFRAITVALPA